tara:strand:+ start:405 stop:743 length:339 start_codon:yes stop_codon:yes gene_type:complete
MSMAPPDQIDAITKRLVDTGVALTVLTATDLFLMGRDQDYGVHRGVLPAHRLIPPGVTCSLSSNNILNPFTPFGNGSLIRMANMCANIALEMGFKRGLHTFTRPAAELHRPH